MNEELREVYARKNAYDTGWLRGNATRQRLLEQGKEQELVERTYQARSRYTSERDQLKRREYMGEYDALTGRE